MGMGRAPAIWLSAGKGVGLPLTGSLEAEGPLLLACSLPGGLGPAGVKGTDWGSQFDLGAMAFDVEMGDLCTCCPGMPPARPPRGEPVC